ncbi:hypothetical protein CWE25_03700 [Idiomarina fontislapidosi]|uniref:Uncharacterized protein n=1 Tax=Idiomarina fontislapidosi TaxID=263723 RepID=A0A432Y9C9_9GAMM|nr:hypothetical protein CWE25_03700 [Idiomarina fontislapidosi]
MGVPCALFYLTSKQNDNTQLFYSHSTLIVITINVEIWFIILDASHDRCLKEVLDLLMLIIERSMNC